MNKLEALFEKTRGKSEAEKSKLIAAFFQNNEEDDLISEALAFADQTQQQMSHLHSQIDKEKHQWLNHAWVKHSEVCSMLYGKHDEAIMSLFHQKRVGEERWSADELSKLEKIRQLLIESLQN